MFEQEQAALKRRTEEELTTMLWNGEYWINGQPILSVLGGLILEGIEEES